MKIKPLWHIFQLQKRLYPTIKKVSIAHIAKNPFVIKNIIAIPMAIQNKINPIIFFMRLNP